MEIYNIHDAKTNLSQILLNVSKGNEVIIGKAGKPVAKIIPYNEENEPREFDAPWRGKVFIADDFDETPKEVVDSFYNSDLYNE
ncbi:type II toxin-antitoxin system prevent-host-death family antitoxin [Rickettsiales bacterium]|nr:type II toxin-antitoxin system prevent-host-death family antitoxin [Rickettsiales bacterium]